MFWGSGTSHTFLKRLIQLLLGLEIIIVYVRTIIWLGEVSQSQYH